MKKDSTKPTPHYNAMLPPKVRYDENLSSSEKVMYAEITSLCYKEGYCWANNSYFAKLYKTDKRTISAQISNLEMQGHIKVEIDKSKGNKRKIYIDDNVPTYRRKRPQVATNTSIPIDENVHQSNAMSSTNNSKDSLVEDKKILNDKPTSSGTNKTFDKDSYPYLISEWLLTLIQRNKPNFYEVKLKSKDGRERWLQRWAYDIDLMIRVDKITPTRIVKVIDWCQGDSFWWKNILSTYKLRKQFQNLETKIVELPKKVIGDTCNLEKIYGKRFLQNNFYTPTEHDMTNFVEAAKRIKAFSRRTNISEDHVVDHLLDCLEERYTNKSEPVFSGHLCSKNTWEILMPQYLKELAPTWDQ